MPPDARILQQLSLSQDEYDRIVDLLDREPNDVELGMFGALWSEHCGYKHSRPLFNMFPTDGEHVLTKAGEENAGVVDIGDGLGVAFKIESHNHPSAIEPYEGAATGVGGIVRDIFAMGARPIALLDSLRFGPLQPRSRSETLAREFEALPAAAFEPDTPPDVAARNRHLFSGVVAGIGSYGNCIGIPTVGGEVSFSPSYSGNPLVNAMCVGIGRIDKLVKARADGPGNLLMLVGADTGRDGIHGATFASVQLDESSEERRPAVQVGNPFLEKLLMEACLELTEDHGEWIAGLQDLGAAGLTSASVECAAKAGTGIIIDVARVPRRESHMTPYEVMLSESQERMLVIVKAEHETDVRDLFQHWELHVETIGVVTDDGLVRIGDGDVEVARVPAKMLTDAPAYVVDGKKPRWLDDLQSVDVDALMRIAIEAEPQPAANGRSGARLAGERRSPNEMLLALLRSPEIASKRIVWRQYDHQVGTNTVVGPGSDAAVLRIKGTTKALAMCTDGNAAYTHLDPYAGGAIAVAEAARNIACTGAKPIAMTNCLNFGNPEKPEVYFQLKEAIRGMSDAARALGIPVVSGNVSLYNESSGEAIWPTPVVGMLGLIDDVERVLPMGLRAGARVVLASASSDSRTSERSGIAGCEYLRTALGVTAGRPAIDLEAEVSLQRFLAAATVKRAILSAHDVASGGLAVALAEACMAGDTGAVLSSGDPAGVSALFSERGARAVLSCPDDVQLGAMAEQFSVQLIELGTAEGRRLRYGQIDLSLDEMVEAFESGLPRAVDGAMAAGG